MHLLRYSDDDATSHSLFLQKLPGSSKRTGFTPLFVLQWAVGGLPRCLAVIAPVSGPERWTVRLQLRRRASLDLPY